MIKPSVAAVHIRKFTDGFSAEAEDLIAAEIPLELRLIYSDNGVQIKRSLSVIMRTPGHDFELAAGFLLTEGILSSFDDVLYIRYCEDAENVVNIYLRDGVAVDVKTAERNFYTASGCGICGKTSIDAVKVYIAGKINTSVTISKNIIVSLPDILKHQQEVFRFTGGLHAAALFDNTGRLILVREDIGRHNATDKLIGAAAGKGLLPLNDYIIMLSGRAGFELVQKAAMAGAAVVAAVGAPSSLSVELAEECNMTLIGFLRENRFNIYTHPSRIIS